MLASICVVIFPRFSVILHLHHAVDNAHAPGPRDRLGGRDEFRERADPGRLVLWRCVFVCLKFSYLITAYNPRTGYGCASFALSSPLFDLLTTLPGRLRIPHARFALVPPPEIFEAVSYYYDIEAWAARTNNCRDTSSVACMACSMPLLESFERAGIAPIGVSNDWWFLP
jgi:hypothetical protein